MMLLQRFDLDAKCLDYESKTEIDKVSNQQIIGWYTFVEGMLSALLVMDNSLYFLHGSDKFLITDTHKILLQETSKGEYECILINGDDVLVRFPYPGQDLKFYVSPFEYIEPEDFIWAEFLARTINDLERKRNFVAILNNYGEFC